MNDIAKKLMNFKDRLEEAKQGESRVEGKIQSLTERLEKSCGCKDETEAEKKIEQLDKRIERFRREIEEGINELEEEGIGE